MPKNWPRSIELKPEAAVKYEGSPEAPGRSRQSELHEAAPNAISQKLGLRGP